MKGWGWRQIGVQALLVIAVFIGFAVVSNHA